MTSFSGPVPDSSFLVAPSFNLEYEMFTSSNRSILFKGIFAMDMADAITKYLFAGVSQRFYLLGRGSSLERKNASTRVSILPKFNVFVGYNVGIGQAVAQTFTRSLQTFTTLLDLGGVAGINYRLSRSIRFEGQLEICYAYGFSSVALSGMVNRGFFGVSYDFR